ncbi:MAG: VOC family protein, partial [Acidimicrobiia bacterium]|nr:VOC family protein [Acidimicrobiia bacterium]
MDITCVTIDCADHRRLAEFWAAALGWEVTTHEHGSIVARPGVAGLYLEFVVVPESKTIKNRVHLGHEAHVDELDTEIAR